MKIQIKRINNKVHLQARNETNNCIDIDGSEAIGGQDLGFRPMQLLLAGIGSCSTMDIISILKKQKQQLKDIEITVEAEREVDKTPALFKTIHVHFLLKGSIDKIKAQRAVELSMEKYCSVSKILEKSAQITYDFTIENQ